MSAQPPDLSVPGIPIDRGLVTRVGQERKIGELEHELATMRAALEHRTTIAVATGLLAERYGCTSSQAWSLLARLSSHTNVKVRDVAQLVIEDRQLPGLRSDGHPESVR